MYGKQQEALLNVSTSMANFPKLERQREREKERERERDKHSCLWKQKKLIFFYEIRHDLNLDTERIIIARSIFCFIILNNLCLLTPFYKLTV